MPRAAGAGDAVGPFPVQITDARQGPDAAGGDEREVTERHVLVPAGRELQLRPVEQAPPYDAVPRRLPYAKQFRALVQPDGAGQVQIAQRGSGELDPALVPDQRVLEDEDVRVAEFGEADEDSGDRVGGDHVVTVHEPHMASGRLGQAHVARLTEAHVRTQMYGTHARIESGVLAHDVAAGIGR